MSTDTHNTVLPSPVALKCLGAQFKAKRKSQLLFHQQIWEESDRCKIIAQMILLRFSPNIFRQSLWWGYSQKAISVLRISVKYIPRWKAEEGKIVEAAAKAAHIKAFLRRGRGERSTLFLLWKKYCREILEYWREKYCSKERWTARNHFYSARKYFSTWTTQERNLAEHRSLLIFSWIARHKNGPWTWMTSSP